MPDNGPAHGFISTRSTPSLLHGQGRTQGLNSLGRQDARLPEFVPSIRTVTIIKRLNDNDLACKFNLNFSQENAQTSVSALRSKFAVDIFILFWQEPPVQTSALSSKNLDNFSSPDRKQGQLKIVTMLGICVYIKEFQISGDLEDPWPLFWPRPS